MRGRADNKTAFDREGVARWDIGRGEIPTRLQRSEVWAEPDRGRYGITWWGQGSGRRLESGEDDIPLLRSAASEEQGSQPSD
jgi:hypothetical protein